MDISQAPINAQVFIVVDRYKKIRMNRVASALRKSASIIEQLICQLEPKYRRYIRFQLRNLQYTLIVSTFIDKTKLNKKKLNLEKNIVNVTVVETWRYVFDGHIYISTQIHTYIHTYIHICKYSYILPSINCIYIYITIFLRQY